MERRSFTSEGLRTSVTGASGSWGADGTDPHPILVRKSGSDPKWSPTDDRILFVDDGDIYFMFMRSNGTNVTNITSEASGESNAI
jgi:hypothetical protein